MNPNRAIERGWQSLYIPAADFCSVKKVDATPEIEGFDANNPPVAQLNSLGVTGVLLATDGYLITHVMPCPRFIDFTNRVLFRVHWVTDSTTTTHTVLWRVRYRALTLNTSALAAPATALNTLIVADTVAVGTAYTLYASPAGIMNADSIASPDTKALMLDLTMQTKTGPTNIWAVGLEIGYVPRLSKNAEKGISAEASLPW